MNASVLREMSATRARASACICAAIAAVMIACGGDARRVDPRQPLEVHIGTFDDAATPWLAGALSSEPLVAADWDGRPAYRLANSATESEDGRVLTFTLRPGVKFHNGETVTAGRVRELLALKAKGGRRLTEIRSIEAPDDRTVVITLKQPHSLKTVDLSDAAIEDDKRPELRAGAFRITSWGPPAVLERFPEYYQGVPAITRVQIDKYPTHRAAWSAMMRAEVNFLHEVNRDAIDFIENGGNIQAYQFLRPFTIPLVFNLRHPVLRRTEVRLALSEAINREAVVQNGMRGHGQAAEGPFWPHHWAYPTGRHRPTFNPEAAKLRLDAANLPVFRAEAHQMPTRFAFTCLLRQGDTRFERIALVVQRQLFDIGVDMRLQTLPTKEFYAATTNGKFDAFLFEMSTGRTLSFPYNFWHSKGSLSLTGYDAADAPLERMKQARTDDEVRVAVAEVMRILRADPPAIFLAMPREARAADRSLEITYQPDRDIFGTFWQVRRKMLAAR